jgi:sirohydrochlorin ferrochelatase
MPREAPCAAAGKDCRGDAKRCIPVAWSGDHVAASTRTCWRGRHANALIEDNRGRYTGVERYIYGLTTSTGLAHDSNLRHIYLLIELAAFAAVYLDEPPEVERGLSLIDADCVVVIPFLIGGGPHATVDIPRRLGLHESKGGPPFVGQISTTKRRRTIIVDVAVGLDERILEIVLDLARQNGLSSTSTLHARLLGGVPQPSKPTIRSSNWHGAMMWATTR